MIYIIWVLGMSFAMGQARIIFPDSTQITTNPDSLDLLPPPLDRRTPNELDAEEDSSNVSDRKKLNGFEDLASQSHDLDHLLHDHGAMADSMRQVAQMYVWTLDLRTGSRVPAMVDTLLYNYQHTTLPDGESVAMGFLGPLGAPSYSKLFFDKKETEPFVFNEAYGSYIKRAEELHFVNTKIPYSRINYQRSGSRQNREERLEARLTSNFGKNLNLGMDVDIINSKGFYNAQAVKHNNFTLFGNYISDRLEAHAYANFGKATNVESGGITDETFIKHPEDIQQSFTAKDIPVKFTDTWNTVKNNRFLVSGRYNLGFVDSPKDSLNKGRGEFVPVASIGLTSQYTSQHRRFLSYDTTFVNVDGVSMQNIDQFYPNRYYNGAVDDSLHYTSFKNTVSLSLREGFKEWVKFGLTAFLEYDLRSYDMRDSTEEGWGTHKESAVTLGGVLNKQQGENLLFNIRADLGLLGANLGEFRAMGDVETGFNIAGKRTTLKAEGYLKNLKPKYLQENYYSKYFTWNNNFGDIRRVYVGGRIFIPFTNTTISAGVENVQNWIYFDETRNIAQESDNIQVLTARIGQNLSLGVFHWDNEVVYQTSSNQDVIPLPKLSVYSNLYIKTKIVNELTLQLGVDAHYHTKYYAPGYEPALLTFYNQREKEIGNYPIATAYANMHLKQTRFFIMFYNLGSQLLRTQDYFTLPGYPTNPSIVKLGLSVNLHN